MGRSSHMKRLAMPRSWPLPRKTSVWVQRPDPCGHPIDRCMPIGIVLRDILGVAGTRREVSQILNKNVVEVDGRVVTSTGRGVGLLDILTVGDQNYMCILDNRGRLAYNPISKKNAGIKFCRLNGKTTIKGGKTQLSFHDGRTVIVDDASKETWATGSTCVIDLASGKIKDTLKAEAGASCYLIGGNHVGEVSTIKEIETKRSSMPNEITFEEGYGTIEDYVMVIPSADSLPLEVAE